MCVDQCGKKIFQKNLIYFVSAVKQKHLTTLLQLCYFHFFESLNSVENYQQNYDECVRNVVLKVNNHIRVTPVLDDVLSCIIIIVCSL